MRHPSRHSRHRMLRFALMPALLALTLVGCATSPEIQSDTTRKAAATRAAKHITGKETLGMAILGDTRVPYVLNQADVAVAPKYVLIVFPGGDGVVNPQMVEGKLVYQKRTNFLLRARAHFVDKDFATVATNATDNHAVFDALLSDLNHRFPEAKLYLLGTSRGTFDTMALASYADGRLAGIIHTASFSKIQSFDTRGFKTKHLLVHHIADGCSHTPHQSAKRHAEKFGTTLITVTGGTSPGDPCKAFSHHGFFGVEEETARKIKDWIRGGETQTSG